MLPRDLMTVGEARKRINAIKQYGSLGAGFKIAMRDLEIRGAGNILGTQQSGHIVNIGFDLYCSLLEQAIAKLKGGKARARLEVVLRTDFVALREAEMGDEHPTSSIQHPTSKAPAFLPAELHRRVAAAHSGVSPARRNQHAGTTRRLAQDVARPFRPASGAAENLLRLTEIKLAAAARKITVVEVREGKLMLTRSGDFILIDGKFPRLTASDPADAAARNAGDASRAVSAASNELRPIDGADIAFAFSSNAL